MCKLFAMSSDQPTDVDDYLTMLMPRGGKIGPQADGWGIAYYEGTASQVFKEATPAASSRYLRILSRAGFKSTSVIAHIRKANPSTIGRGTANTHPFEREWSGYSWVFAHNGKLPGFSHLSGYPDSRFKHWAIPTLNWLSVTSWKQWHATSTVTKKFYPQPLSAS